MRVPHRTRGRVQLRHLPLSRPHHPPLTRRRPHRRQPAHSTQAMQLTTINQHQNRCRSESNSSWTNSMNNPRRSNSTKRNKLRAQVLREETNCWLCGQFVDVKLKAGLPESPEVDEILPVSLGGNPYDRSNTRLAHRLCNQKRSNKLPAEAIEAARNRTQESQPLKTSREW